MAATDNLYGGLAGTGTGLVGAFVAGIFQLVFKRLRNRRYIRRGEPPAKDLVFTPFFLLLAITGFIAGICWTWQLQGTWVTGAIAGAGPPAVLTLGWLVAALAQLRR